MDELRGRERGVRRAHRVDTMRGLMASFFFISVWGCRV
jgi:hypothetical protein